MKTETFIERKHIISIGELKRKLGLKGEFVMSGLYEGLSPEDEVKGVSRDKETIEIIMREKVEHKE